MVLELIDGILGIFTTWSNHEGYFEFFVIIITVFYHKMIGVPLRKLQIGITDILFGIFMLFFLNGP